jgi:signal transduction histidine kinase
MRAATAGPPAAIGVCSNTPAKRSEGLVAARLSLVLGAIVALGAAAVAGSFALALTSDHVPEPGLQAALMGWITLPYVIAGTVAWHRRPTSRLGPLMIAAGLAMSLSTLAWSDGEVAHAVGRLFDLLPAAVFLHLYLAFPDGRLEGRTVRAIVVAGYAVAPRVTDVLIEAQLIALSALCLAGVAVLARRRRAAPPLRRSTALVADAFSLALTMVAVLFLAGAFDLPAFETLRRVTFFTVGLVPFAYLVAVACQRLARGLIGDLVVELRAGPGPSDLRNGIARALRDPSLRLAYWLPDYGSWADLEGRSIDLPEPDHGRVTRVAGHDGGPVAALVHDPALAEEPELLDAVSAAAGIALENGRLHAELRARLIELRDSRERVIAVEQRERQRLERDLHDGAQQRLIALGLELSLLEKRLDVDGALAHARAQVTRSLEELREVAHGLHPAVVSGHGLAVALESLALDALVPVTLQVEVDRRLPDSLEVAAYYVVAESLANVAKHAHASAAVVVVRVAGGRLVVEVTDDGIGGADTERGSGLRGLADRVEALDGRLRVWSPAGHGTRVRAEVPCRP